MLTTPLWTTDIYILLQYSVVVEDGLIYRVTLRTLVKEWVKGYELAAERVLSENWVVPHIEMFLKGTTYMPRNVEDTTGVTKDSLSEKL